MARSASPGREPPPSAAGSAQVSHAAGRPRAPAAGDAGGVAGRPRAGSEGGPALRAARALRVPVLTSAPAARRRRRPRPAPSGRRLPRRRGAGRSAPAPGRGGPGGRADSPARLPPRGPRGGGARRRSPDALHHSRLGRRAPPAAPRPAPTPAAGARCALPGRGVLPRALALHAAGRTPVTPGRSWGGYAPREDRPRRWGRDNCLFRGPCLQCDLISAAHARVPSLRPVKKCKIEPFPVHTKRPIVRMCLVPRLLGRLERSGEAPAADVLSRRGGWPWAGVMCAGVFLNCG